VANERPRGPDRGSWFSRFAEGRRKHPVALGCGVSAGLLASYIGWESAFGHLWYASEYSLGDPEMIGPRIAVTVILLIGFTVGGSGYENEASVRDAQSLTPLLRCSPEEHAALVGELQTPSHSRAWIGGLAAIPIGIFLVTSKNPWIPYLLSHEPWNHDLVWALASNVLLFAFLGRVAVRTFEINTVFGRMENRLRQVDLLRPERLARFARRGLRAAFFWIGGSSIASIVFVNQQFSWLTGLALGAAVSMGTIAFLLPVRLLHFRIRAAKELELERVREAIERDRNALLKDSCEGGVVPTRMAGLLAYEHRIASVHEWPIDTPEVIRFGLLLLLGFGSWLGGAVVGHLVDLVWH
jgi:hypothetical protein